MTRREMWRMTRDIKITHIYMCCRHGWAPFNGDECLVCAGIAVPYDAGAAVVSGVVDEINAIVRKAWTR